MFFLVFAFVLGVLDGVWSPPRKRAWSTKVVVGQSLARLVWCGALGILAGQLGVWVAEAAFLMGFGRQVFFVPAVGLLLLALGWLGWRWRLGRRPWVAPRLGHPFAGVIRVSSLLLAALLLAMTTWEVRQAAVAMLCFGFGALPGEVAQSLFSNSRRWEQLQPLAASSAAGGLTVAALVLASPA